MFRSDLFYIFKFFKITFFLQPTAPSLADNPI
nr:MAG TPA: hypothetical protein [Caudoviricetes sp.]